jgi:hypothetical protein
LHFFLPQGRKNKNLENNGLKNIALFVAKNCTFLPHGKLL